MTPRLLTIMGSGETAPTMVKVHRSVVEQLGPGPVHGLLLDTPFGFQTNATEIAAVGGDVFPAQQRGRHARGGRAAGRR